MTNSVYRLEKHVWNDGDFDELTWHDVRIWSMAADPDAFDFSLDLDFIFRWEAPVAGSKSLRFWVAPVTMVLENAHSSLSEDRVAI